MREMLFLTEEGLAILELQACFSLSGCSDFATEALVVQTTETDSAREWTLDYSITPCNTPIEMTAVFDSHPRHLQPCMLSRLYF